MLSIELWIGHRLEDWQRIDIWLVMKADWIGEWPLDGHRIQMDWRLIELNYGLVIFSHFSVNLQWIGTALIWHSLVRLKWIGTDVTWDLVCTGMGMH